MAQHASTYIAFSTIMLECTILDGVSKGTGLLWKIQKGLNGSDINTYCIFTNKHVIEDSTKITFSLSMTSDKKVGAAQIRKCDLVDTLWNVSLHNLKERIIMHPVNDVDICAIIINDILLKAPKETALRHTFMQRNILPDSKLLSELNFIEPIVMAGYPHGIWDKTNNLPIIRSGHTATHPSYSFNGKEEFLIDVANFSGSSGSPVYLYENWTGHGILIDGADLVKFTLLGILYAGPQVTEEREIEIDSLPENIRTQFEITSMLNLGIVINSKEIIRMEDEVISTVKTRTSSQNN